jgi:C4-dicarboxylate-specific signal transduction histidine kinase
VDEVEIVFSDSGPGVEAAYRDYIFDPYFCTRSHGVGLGLTIAGEIINEYYAGALELLDSGPLSGATFRITLHTRV